MWFDALLNYYTALSYARAGEDLTDELWPASYHLIAKDILRFHAVYWPALLMAAGLELPEHVFVHGYLLMEGEKMSKSLGNVLDPFAVIERFGADALRFYLLRDVPFGQDGSVSTASFELRYETELANELGNLASRTIAMLLRYRDGRVPRGRAGPGARGRLRRPRRARRELIDRAELTLALEEIWQRVRRLNRYVEEQAPWQLAKDEAARERARPRCSRTLLEGLRVVAVLLWPYLPASAERLLAALGAPDARLAGAELGSGQHRARRRALERAVPEGRAATARSRRPMIDSHTHLDLCEPPDAELVRGGRRGRRDADADRRHRRRLLPRRAGGGRGLPAGLRGDRAPPERRAAASTTPTWPSCARWPRTSAAWRSARPAWTSTATAPRAPTRSARSPRRSRSRARPASRW